MPRGERPAGNEWFVGRVSELAAIGTCVDAVSGGAGRVVWVEGDPGSGKTALVSHVVAELPAGFVVLRAAAEESAADQPFAVLDQLGIEGGESPHAAGLDLVALLTEAGSRGPVAVDFTAYALQMVTAYGWSQWQEQDWTFWIFQSIPQTFNFIYQFRTDGTNQKQAFRDVYFGVLFLIWSSVYAHFWPSNYKDAPKVPGLVLSANVFTNASGICELILLLFGFDQILPQQVVKIVLAAVGNMLGFVANVLGLVDS